MISSLHSRISGDIPHLSTCGIQLLNSKNKLSLEITARQCHGENISTTEAETKLKVVHPYEQQISVKNVPIKHSKSFCLNLVLFHAKLYQ